MTTRATIMTACATIMTARLDIVSSKHKNSFVYSLLSCLIEPGGLLFWAHSVNNARERKVDKREFESSEWRSLFGQQNQEVG
jgi:hypothetical protein